MKTLQKATLAVAIAAVPFMATNALEALDDDFLSEMTGQAGVTIETTTGATGTTIGHIHYTDTDGQNEATGGTVAIERGTNGVAISNTGVTWDGTAWVGADVTTRQIIDVDSNGNLIIQKENVGGNSTKLEIGQVSLRSTAQQAEPEATRVNTGAILVQDLSIIKTEGTTGSTHIVNLTEATNSRVDASGLYTNGTMITAADEAKLDRAQGMGAKMAIVSKGSSKIERLDAKLLDGAIEIENLSYKDANDANGFMTSTQVIWAVGGTATATNDAGVWIQGSASTGTLAIGAIKIGGSSIGQIDIGTISQAGNTTRIYGH